jgi:branched-chain amino acid transport system ATP-binding protein
VVVIGCVLFMPRGIVSLLVRLRVIAAGRGAFRRIAAMPGARGMTEPLLRVEHAVKRFGGRVALDDAHCSVPAGSITGMIGPNGSGKSTLFNCIAGTDQLDSARCICTACESTGWPARDLRTRHRTHVPADAPVPRHERAREPDRRRPFVQYRQAVERALAALELLEITELVHRPASELSYGQRKLVEIGRTLMLAPKLMLLDEPFAGINPACRIASSATCRSCAMKV